jgi:23S rRNA (cytidine1920-2'-O)/16S rRNA (cytidine1409-2'-O)-methyltransferase
MKKIALLELMVKQFPQLNREKLYSRIMCGEVFVDKEKNINPFDKVSMSSEIEFAEKQYVSRGGLKLKAALEKWQIPVDGKIFLDAGSSTGGFTDCLLQYGATKIHSVDVGYNQLAYSLRIDQRVCVHEKCNIMHLDELNPDPHAAVADLSFRSIKGAGRHIINLTSEKWLIALIKPQFEIDTHIYPHFTGIIKDKIELKSVLYGVLDKIYKDTLFVEEAMLSPVKGRKGNIEFLFLIRDNRTKEVNSVWMDQIGQELDQLIDGMT